MIRNLKNYAIVLITLLAFTQCSSPVDIEQWRGPDRNGIFPETNLLKVWPTNGPELLWKYEDLGKGYSSAAITKEKVYTLGTTDSTSFLFAFNHSGDLEWKKELGQEFIKSFPGARTTPLIIDNMGYIMSGLGVVYCFDTETGNTVWSVDFMTDHNADNIIHGITENLIADGDIIYCTPGGKEVNVAALDRLTGEFIWKSKANSGTNAYCSPIIINRAEKKLLVTMTFNELIALDIETGEMLWKKDLKEAKYGIHANTPIFHDNHLLTMEGWSYGSFMLKIAEDGMSYEEVWTNDTLDPQLGDAVLLDNRLYGSSGTNNEWYCVDWYTGELKSVNKDLGTGIICSADDMLYIYTYGGKMAIAQPNPDGFDVVSTFQIGSKKKDHFSYPVIKDGRLYVRHNNAIFVYSIKKEV